MLLYSSKIFISLDGCNPPSPLADGSISEYSSGAVGAMLTFQCDTGYMPQEEVTSTCLPNSSWIPVMECISICDIAQESFNVVSYNVIISTHAVVDCYAPITTTEVIFEPFNYTKLGALITFHCEESSHTVTTVCGNNGEWFPNPASHKCGKGEYIMKYYSISNICYIIAIY